MATQLHAGLKNDTNHRNVFTITDMVVAKVLFDHRNMDADEVLENIALEKDDDDKAHVKWDIAGQVGGERDDVLDGDTVLMS